MPVSLSIFMAFTSLAISAAQTETVRNEKVAVADGTIKSGETETLPGSHPSVTVYFTDGSLRITPAAGKPSATPVRRGDAVFHAAQAGTVQNTGSSEVHFARVEFLGSGGPETWGTAGLSPNYKLLLENQFARVYDIRIPAGAREPQHTHKDRIAVCLSGAKLMHLLPDGHEEPSTLRTGESVWRHGGTHIGQNLGSTDLWVIAIEPK